MSLLSLEILKSVIEEHLLINEKLHVFSPKVVLGNISNGIGENPGMVPPNCICLTVVNIREVAIFKRNPPSGFQRDKFSMVDDANEIFFENFVLISSTYTDYRAALTMLYATLNYLQSNSVFTLEKLSPDLLQNLNSISDVLMYEKFKFGFEFYGNSFEELKNIWSMINSKMLPSALYKLRVIESKQKKGH